ncbi:MAG: response regulator [Candidatus Magasanikbacteria bacterium]|nr:response regulator [Candidatus Magasanikbacteria bacterium]
MTNQSNRPTILVIEDEESLLNAIATSLEGEGFQVIKSRIADQAWQYLKDVGLVDLIWLDHYLLGEDGIYFTKRLRGDEKLKGLPVFVVSNSENPVKEKEYEELGVIKYYTKSENSLEKIISEIKKYLAK